MFTTEPNAAPQTGIAPEGVADWAALERRGKLAVGILVILAIVDSVSIVANLLELDVLTRILDEQNVPELQVFLSGLLLMIVGFTQLIGYGLAVVFFCRWMLQAFRNVLATEPWRVSYSPRDAVVSFFIPFLNLVRPFRAMRELFEASEDPGRSTLVVRVWWGFYLAMAMLGNAASRVSWRAEATSELILATHVSIVADAISVPAALLAAHLVRRVSAGLPLMLRTSSEANSSYATASSTPGAS